MSKVLFINVKETVKEIKIFNKERILNDAASFENVITHQKIR